jgi:Tfp pilus assembly protein PilX
MKKGFILIPAIIIMAVLLIVSLYFSENLFSELNIARNQKKSDVAFYIAEAGAEKAQWSLNQPGSTYTGETNTPFEGGKFTTTVIDSGLNQKTVASTGYYPASSTFSAKRTVQIKVEAAEAENYSFQFAVQTGVGGVSMASNSTINGSSYTNGSISGSSNSRITGDAYAVGTISNPPTALSKHPGSPPTTLPSIDYNFWKTQANINNDPYIGNYSLSGTDNLGPKKIQGNMSLVSNSSLTVDGPIWVTGNFSMSSNSELHLNNTFGSKGTVIIVDGTISLSSNAAIYPTNATPKGYLLMISTSSSNTAIDLSSNSAALDGGVTISSNGHAKCVVSKKLTLNSNASLDYDTGLAGAIFTTGPGGIWSPASKSWQEIIP